METLSTLYNLKTEFKNLTEEQLKEGYNEVLSLLLNIRKEFSKAQAIDFLDKTLTKFSDVSYRMRFRRINNDINPQGLALSKSFTKNLKREMRLQWSIWNYFRKLDYDHSELKQYVRNAKKLHQVMPQNSSLTITH